MLLPLYAFVNPPVTTVMLLKALGGNGIDKSWTGIEDISPRLVRAVITSEDQRFCFHHGIDWVEVQNALDDEDGRFRGASTITMQTMKNLFLWTGRSWIRKALEAPLALYGELFLSKRRIMEIYLNIVEWDEGVYGAAAASQHYFRVPPAQLCAHAERAPRSGAPLARYPRCGKPGRGTARIARRMTRGWRPARQMRLACDYRGTLAKRERKPLYRPAKVRRPLAAPVAIPFWSFRCRSQNEKPRA